MTYIRSQTGISQRSWHNSRPVEAQDVFAGSPSRPTPLHPAPTEPSILSIHRRPLTTLASLHLSPPPQSYRSMDDITQTPRSRSAPSSVLRPHQSSGREARANELQTRRLFSPSPAKTIGSLHADLPVILRSGEGHKVYLSRDRFEYLWYVHFP